MTTANDPTNVPEPIDPHGVMREFVFPDAYAREPISEQNATVLAPMVGESVHEAITLALLRRAATDQHDWHGERIDDALADLLDGGPQTDEQRAAYAARWAAVNALPVEQRAAARRALTHGD